MIETLRVVPVAADAGTAHHTVALELTDLIAKPLRIEPAPGLLTLGTYIP